MNTNAAGKTEAARLAAHALMARGEAEGFGIRLPTMTTANGVHVRLASSYRGLFEEAEKNAPSLIQATTRVTYATRFRAASAWSGPSPATATRKESTTSGSPGTFCAAWLAADPRKALPVSCGVGLLDQALLAVLPVEHQCLLLLGLDDNAQIADEVHASATHAKRFS
ncbi:hypothetical protein [Solidesulfovibrio sp.]|uniref:hypothetical protein n=1 Tax=Solidesulfovibrio sp. TaxID=2910990 RepID=UPI00260CB2F6|nr:hypothetical protein [Solidesulfovibrio sp.]